MKILEIEKSLFNVDRIKRIIIDDSLTVCIYDRSDYISFNPCIDIPNTNKKRLKKILIEFLTDPDASFLSVNEVIKSLKEDD